MGAQVAGWVLQAVALDRGPLIVVQCLTAMSLVMALPLGMWLTKQQVGWREWSGAAAVLIGIMFFLWAGSPSGGTNHPSAFVWWRACLGTLLLVVVLGGFGFRAKGAHKALMFGAAAGICFGLQAAVTKTFTGELGNGVLSLLADWSVYVLIASALVGFVLQQSALKTGVLAPALASSNAVTLFASVLFGVDVFGEKLTGNGGGHIGAAVIGLLVALVGVGLLAGSEAPPPAPEATETPPGLAPVS
jgi:drug/metabolite transporter (DMT)-like permease